MNATTAPSLAERLHAALPQTQCTRCGYADCAAYAQAIATGAAAINQCPPGGTEGIHRLASITGRPALPLNPANGVEGPRVLAVIDEDWCIGCTLCMKACPTDAILGAHKMMHTVIAPHCTGCELCVPVCPVDCIQLENISGVRSGWSAWSQQEADTALRRYEFHSQLRAQESPRSIRVPSRVDDKMISSAPKTSAGTAQPAADASEEMSAKKRALIEAALARARTVRQAVIPSGQKKPE